MLITTNLIDHYTCSNYFCYFHFTFQFSAPLDAFCGMKSRGLSPIDRTVMYEMQYATKGSSFLNNAITVASSDAIYWMHISVDVPAQGLARVYLNGAAYTFALYKNHTIFNDTDTMSRQGIMSVNDNMTLVSMRTNYASSGTGYRQPYWAGFRMDSFFRPFNAFHVIRSSPFVASAKNSTVVFDIAIYDLGKGWDDVNSQFVAPKVGLYFFTFGGGLPKQKDQQNLTLNVNANIATMVELGLVSLLQTKSDVDFVSKSLFIRLMKKDKVSVKASKGVVLNGDSYNCMIYFAGFHYSPPKSKHVRNVSWNLVFLAALGLNACYYRKWRFIYVDAYDLC